MISQKDAKTQVMRLSALQGFPTAREALSDLIMAFQMAWANETAAAAAENFLDTATAATRCPVAAQIRIWIHEHQKPKKPEPVSNHRAGPHCSTCQGFGIKESTYAGDIASMATRCECVAGCQYINSDWIDRVNAARAKLRAIKATPAKAKPGLVRVAHLPSDVFGDF